MLRYQIKELTDEGRLITPMYRPKYDYGEEVINAYRATT